MLSAFVGGSGRFGLTKVVHGAAQAVGEGDVRSAVEAALSGASAVRAAANGVVVGQRQVLDPQLAAKDDQQRLDVLKRRWDEVVLAAAYCHVMSDTGFHESVRYWQSGWLSTGTWTVASDGDLTTPPGPMSKATVLVRGDCRTDVTTSGLVHIYGDLASKIIATGQSEVVIGGDIRPSGSIEGDGITRVFIGGNLEGQISNRGSSVIWLNGDLDGEVRAGRPSTHLHVMGDVRGSLKPLGPAALAYLDVRGMMSSEKVETVARHGWTQFNASIGTSDVPPGLYPKSQTANAFWIVHSRLP